MDDNNQLNSILWKADFEELHRYEDPEFIEVPVSDMRNSLVLFRFKKSAAAENVQKRPAA